MPYATPCSNLTFDQSNSLYDSVLRQKDTKTLRRLCQEDLFFLLTRAFKRFDANRPWIYERCRDVELEPDENLDLWAREHYKSTIITYAKTIQDILNDPEVTVGIFSHTRPIAKAFLEQIKRELETNTFLQDLFPDILYKEPKKEASKWSLDSGITVKRNSNPKEATVEAWGLVDGQPTSKHFKLLVFDDVVTKESVTTPDQIKKVTDAWALSLNLGAEGGRRRYIGTRYHENDTYAEIIRRRSVEQIRVHAPTDLGQSDILVEGLPVLFEKKNLLKKREDMGPYIYACQMLQNPMADRAMGFQKEWLRFYDILRNHTGWNFYILVDPASEKKDSADFTTILVIALAPDKNYYLVDGVRDRLNLTERTKALFSFHRKWHSFGHVNGVGYEKYGIQADIEHIKYVQERENYRFEITALGGQVAKNDRIRRLVPVFEQGRFWMPHRHSFVDQERKPQDLIQNFLDQEYVPFPVCVHDDMLDCMARILDSDLDAKFPDLIDIRRPSQTMEDDHSMVQTEYDVLA